MKQTNPLHALVVDDHDYSLTIVRITLEKLGCTIDTAETGEIALAKLLKVHTYDFVIMDVDLPEMSGLEVTRRYLVSTKQPVPIIGHTITETDQRKQECLEAGMLATIPKLFNQDEGAKLLEYIKTIQSTES